MIQKWVELNKKGRLLFTLCIINLLVSLILVLSGSLMGLFSGFMAAFCGLSTYLPAHQKK